MVFSAKTEADFGIKIYLQLIVAPSFQEFTLVWKLLNLCKTSARAWEHTNWYQDAFLTLKNEVELVYQFTATTEKINRNQWRASFQNLGMAINRVISEKKKQNFIE